MQDSKVSLVIIGAGITGLSAAIAYAKNVDISRHPVLVLEQHKIVGGMVTSFRRKGFLFDTAQIIPDPMEMFQYLGIDLKLKRFDNYFARIFMVNGSQKTGICIPSGFTPFENMLTERYPEDEKAIKKLFASSRAMFNELKYLKPEPSFFDFINILIRCPKTVKYSGKTFKEYFKSFGFTNPECEGIFDVFAAFSGLPAVRAVAMLTVATLNTSLIYSCRPVDGFIHLPLAMKKSAEALGCQVRTNARVSKIMVENGQVKGVMLDNGDKVYADYVITTADPKVAMKELVGIETIRALDAKYARKVEEVKMSASSITINLGLDDHINLKNHGLDCGYNIITTGGDTFERLFQAFDRNEMIMDENMFHCAVICPSLTSGGKPAIIIRIVPVPMADWKELRENDYRVYVQKKEKIADFYINIVEKYLIPGLKKHILYRDIITPATFERYTGSPTGSNYDMAPYPDNFGLKRLKMRTPVKGLFQPKFSHGIWPSMQGGLQVADMILKGKIMGGYSRYRG
jgi:all-trans-retinol 13,14-reductase